MKKDIRPYLPFYMGCKVNTNIPGPQVMNYGTITMAELTPENYRIILSGLKDQEDDLKRGDTSTEHWYCRLNLRRVSSMSGAEMEELILSLINTSDLKEEDHLSGRHIEFEFTREMYNGLHCWQIAMECSTFEGEIMIFDNCDIMLVSDSGEHHPPRDQGEKIRWFCDNEFDAFGLIDAGLAEEYK